MPMAPAEQAGSYVAITKYEAFPEAHLGASGSGAVQSSSPAQPHIEKRPTNYDCAITHFVEWYCSEPRPSFRTVVLRYRILLEQRRYAPTTIILRLAVRRVAFRHGLLHSESAHRIN